MMISAVNDQKGEAVFTDRCGVSSGFDLNQALLRDPLSPKRASR
jgi:hypothetical protein